ncbi:MAG TPA: hypothetical protein VGG75_38090 [Trebonia sp.]|jgi:hypothetical protein
MNWSNSQGACLAQAPEVTATEALHGLYQRLTSTAPFPAQAA